MQVRQARPEEAARVAHVLAAAAAGLARKGQPLWGAAEVSEDAVKDHVQAGRYYLAVDGGEAVGAFRLDAEDRLFWPEVTDASSVFLHKLAVHPLWQGRGVARALLDHACEVTRQRGCRYLRLDCMGGRPKLRAVYEDFDFRHHSDKALGGGQVFHRFEFDVGGA